MGFSQTNLFGDLPEHSFAPPLYRKSYASHYTSTLSMDETKLSQRWADILRSLEPRIPRPYVRKPDFAVYTDAASLSSNIASLALFRQGSEASIKLLSEAKTPIFQAKQIQQKNPMIGMEMLAPVDILWASPELS